MSKLIDMDNKRSFRRNPETYIDLTKNVGPIPKGRYKLLERTRNGFVCECGRKILFGLESISEDYFHLTQNQEIGALTSVEEFLVRYWSLMDEISRKPAWRILTSGSPKTFCLLDPSLEFHA